MLKRLLIVRAAGTVVRPLGGMQAAAMPGRLRRSRGLTLVEMLVALAITLLMMAAVVTVFANVTQSVTRRRATLEMSGQLRAVREQLQRDLEGATCPAIPSRRPEANEGYLELIEGPQTDAYPSVWLWDSTDAEAEPDPVGTLPGIDLNVSFLPSSNLGGAVGEDGPGLAIGSNEVLDEDTPTDGRGLGDADDTLMLTVRSETSPFVGRIPARNGSTPANAAFGVWGREEVESSLAEVVWFALENPTERAGAETFAFGEPGFRTIHRRALLIVPDLDYGIDVTPAGIETANPNTVSGRLAGPGVVRVLGNNVDRTDISLALAALIAFQDRYDLSVRVEWDPTLPNSAESSGFGRWVIRANTLGDLTKRENRYEHHGYVFEPQTLIPPAGNGNSPARDRYFPFAAVSAGLLPASTPNVTIDFRVDRDLPQPTQSASFRGVTDPVAQNYVVAYEPAAGDVAADLLNSARVYAARPLVRLTRPTDTPATARAVLNEDGQVVHVTRGLAPLGGERRGDDVMMTDALSFDLKVYDPGVPVYSATRSNTGSPRVANVADRLLTPEDPTWEAAFWADLAATWPTAAMTNPNLLGDLTATATVPYQFERRGAYVDLGYGLSHLQFTGANTGRIVPAQRHAPRLFFRDSYAASGFVSQLPFFDDGLMRVATGVTNNETANGLAITRIVPGVPAMHTLYPTYDTWSQHYEQNGVNEDRDNQTDESIDGFESPGMYPVDTNDAGLIADAYALATALGPDDSGERETRPPYDASLRGVQVRVRVYERDSRQVRESIVRESFVPE
ncbi:type II secretion system protein [Botrimarina hoheduenensis]|uniref:Prepilin-type N-terminal cleavage/methylation domain-containing protein n=1 Tax=Botrimarina hoheduenensis TaxID=2528000 RepID=A0A5C5VYV8_9BACT|nr:type II secretion system protein [Botrimarina hoheduenensis]TWT43225.1 hypothetical protein Pla111_21750 [Botrimarina hoheduenensis]